MNYIREMEVELLKAVGKKPVIVLYGARQVGKTTLVKHLLGGFKNPSYIQCDDPKQAELLTKRSVPELLEIVEGHDVVILDEAQRIPDIGTTLKLIADNASGVQIIATGSSSFELANKLSEPLTGRNRTLHLYPLSVGEIVHAYGLRETQLRIETYLTYGMYPQIVAAENIEEKKKLVSELAQDYLFRDLFMLGDIRNPFAFEKLVKVLALRVGSEISYADVAKEIGISRDTVFQYVTLLERAFIVFRLTPFYRNKEKEVTKSHKIFFFDNGIRNALIGNFDAPEIRPDKGALLENFFVSEKMKRREYSSEEYEPHFWRTRAGAEIDFVESGAGSSGIRGTECKWKDGDTKAPLPWRRDYPEAAFDIVTKDTVVKHLLPPGFRY
jgi:uncharacterized protein